MAARTDGLGCVGGTCAYFFFGCAYSVTSLGRLDSAFGELFFSVVRADQNKRKYGCLVCHL